MQKLRCKTYVHPWGGSHGVWCDNDDFAAAADDFADDGDFADGDFADDGDFTDDGDFADDDFCSDD